MTFASTVRSATMAIAAFSLASTSSADAPPSTADMLSVDRTMFAAFVDPEDPNQDVVDALVAHGYLEDEIQRSSSPGWAYVLVPPKLHTRADIERRVQGLLDTGTFDLVTPVYLDDASLPRFPTRDMLVQFEATMGPDAMNLVIAETGAGTLLTPNFAGTSGLAHIRSNVRSGEEALLLARELHDRPETTFAHADAIYWAERYGGGYIPNDPQFSSQWALNQANDQDMDAPEAWELTTGDSSVTVVVLDSGIQQNHPDLNQLSGQDFTGGSNGGGPNSSCDNHGTAVAGCIAATIDNNYGLVGIAPGCKVRAGKIFNEIFLIFFCLPFLESQDSWTVSGINWAASAGDRAVTNSSWGGGTGSASVSNAFSATRSQGVVHFAASGNDGTSSIGYPANLSSVNAVGALASSGNRASFSTYGNGLFISAPGAAVLTTDRTGGDGYAGGDSTTIDGTSFSSPYAAGVAALVLSADPTLTPDEVENAMAYTAVDRGSSGYDTTYGWGFVNAHAAVESVYDAPSECPADLNGDGLVDGGDLGQLLPLFNTTECGVAADLNGDCLVDGADLGLLILEWGACQP
ncbi:MAG: S8 family serine peptidase [Phycisphaerales bacterium]|nr:S8 family serine peptidase [Phycisphaerales bacterium]